METNGLSFQERKRIIDKRKRKVMTSKNRTFRPQKDGRARVSKAPMKYVADNKKLSRNKKTLVIVQRLRCFQSRKHFLILIL